MESFRIIGTSPPRFDTPDKARGRAKYAGDYTAPGLLHVALVHAPIPHGILKTVKVPPLPDDCYAFTAKDFAVNLLPSVMNDQPALAEEHIRFLGEPVAIIAAPSAELARGIASSVQVDCTPLPVVDDMRAALLADAPKLFDAGNLCSELHSEKGDVAAGFAASGLVLEDSFELPVQNPAFLEPEACFTRIDDKGRLAIISSTQNAFADRSACAQVLGIPEDQITSKAATVGGGFGGKDGNTSQVFPALVTWKTGRPAKYVFTREENMMCGMKRHSAHIEVKVGFDLGGKLLAYEGRMWMDTGAYAVLGPAVLGLGTEHMTGPYLVPHVKLDTFLSYTNHTPASAMRGFGAPQTAFAIESLMHRAAAALGLSDLEIRRRNILHRGERISMGAPLECDVAFEEALDQFSKSELVREMYERPEAGCGYGLACAMMSCGMGKHVPDTVHVRLERKLGGGYLVRVGLVDIGQGGQTTLGMIAAEALGAELHEIEVRLADSEETSDSGSTAASRMTYICGKAIIEAAEKLKAGQDAAEATVAFPEIAGEDGMHKVFSFIAQCVKLKIDEATGAVKLLRVHNTTEAGRIIHPQMMAGQIFGGIVMSEGYALTEQIRYRGGVPLEKDFSSYVLPTALDAPSMTNDNYDFSEATGPYGAKGVAEAATVALAPAVTAAVEQLCPGLAIKSLPIDREEVLKYAAGGEA